MHCGAWLTALPFIIWLQYHARPKNICLSGIWYGEGVHNLASYSLLDYTTNSNFIPINRWINKKKKLMCSTFDVGDYLNCKVHEMKVNKTKNDEYLDKFG